MGYAAEWLKGQWKQKGFRILAVAMAAATLVLAVEFHLFQYGIFKIIRYYLILWSLAAIAWVDYRSRRIPNKALFFLMLTRTIILVPECLLYRGSWMSICFSAAAAFLLGGGMFLFCFAVTKGIGAGDVKLFAVLGYYVGGAVFTIIFLTILFAACYSGIALLLKKVKLKQEIPFAPFILAGALAAMLLGV